MNLNFLISLQPIGSHLPLGVPLLGTRLVNSGSVASTFTLAGPLGTQGCCESTHCYSCLPPHWCGLPCLTMVAASRPAGSSMGMCHNVTFSSTPQSHLGRLEGTVFYPVATPCWCWNTCEATISESLKGIVPWLSALSLESLAFCLYPFTSTPWS